MPALARPGSTAAGLFGSVLPLDECGGVLPSVPAIENSTATVNNGNDRMTLRGVTILFNRP
jgi:hypothetical protein